MIPLTPIAQTLSLYRPLLLSIQAGGALNSGINTTVIFLAPLKIEYNVIVRSFQVQVPERTLTGHLRWHWYFGL